MNAPKRRYRNNLNFVEAGFRACWNNAKELVAASDKLLQEGLHAPALSLAVLALEEIGKFCAIDGLLSARTGDQKSKRLDKSLKDHGTKLAVVPALPFLIGNLSRADPRFGSDQAYSMGLVDCLRLWKTCWNELAERLENQGLNEWKQKGLYVRPNESAFVTPREAIPLQLAEAAYRFACQSITTLDFVLKDGNLDRYMQQARLMRATMTESDHQTFEATVRRWFEGSSDERVVFN